MFQSIGAEAWGQSVADLLQELSQTHPQATTLRDGALELDKAYIPARYPDAHPSGSPRRRYTKAEADRLIDHAQRIIEWCESLLPAK